MPTKFQSRHYKEIAFLLLRYENFNGSYGNIYFQFEGEDKMTKQKLMSLNQALKYASKYEYDEIENAIGEKFSIEEFYKCEGNSRNWLVYPNIVGHRGKLIQYVRRGTAYRFFSLIEK